MRRVARVVSATVAVAGAVLLPATAAHAQSATELQVVEVDTDAYPQIALTVDVPGAAPGMAWRASVQEAGSERPAELVEGGRGGMEVGLVIDTSGSMAGAPMQAARAAAAAFVSKLPTATRVAVVGFGNAPYLVSPMSSDAAALGQAIAGLGASGETALYDGIQLAASQFTSADVPRSLILVSDGGDTVSATSLESVTARLVADDIRLFGVRLVTDETNVAVLDGLAAATHGRTVNAVDANSLATTYEAIAGSALAQLRLTYRSDAHGQTPLVITVRDGAVEHRAAVTLSLPVAPTAPPTTTASVAATVDAAATEPSRTGLLAGAALLFVALVLLTNRVVQRPPRSLLAARQRRQAVDVRDVKRALAGVLDRSLERRGRRQALGARLEQAGIALRPGEYLVLVCAAAAFAFLSGALLGGLGLGLLFAVAASASTPALLRSRTSRRRAALALQLEEMLQQLTSSLRAGYGVMQAIDAVAREIDAPMSDELRRVVTEVQLGRDLAESLRSVAERIGGQDFEWVVQAIEINREVGGDLVEVLESVADTIRAREQLRRQIKTLSAEGRLSARIMLAMPFVLAAVLSLLNPGYLSPFVEHAIGPVLLGFGGVLMLVGWTWLRRIVRIEF